ncbi:MULTISPECIES: Na+/H+ antiporter [unclassified Streptomyces]|uniref:Na+/H+ antiporter n=2 Tax=Streptomyces TaxID=1883 RepID=A0ABU2RMU7_9ACTN|nr:MULTISPECIES: Na+/H+ antiporter [unclassified Streptomyces]MYR64477.1 Na+/H+ antiporter [Streptomyces sp. SID4939]MYS00146.1 Na+/H+ antiporter [Streptomyces sp. SID4940]MYT64725.1 Na+/H+ antiporter [Streptomyces sp. SID8357]MYT87729.1 Na+/H+ antiporter [Streptomyces sp. SID8360]MYW36899.1 Na+/H+ antiporter [Streptomyces sp. SID1]MYX72932.1 Na+/H+ antiporter [Streptomyces sp. SID3915]HBF84110.1 Na+/H+ antiporter [Streptomyces sp.]
MDQMALLLLLLLGAVVTVPLGQRLGLPAPVLMTLVGVAMAFTSFVPDIDIPPEIILPALLPPLLYASVQRTSWRQFAANKRPIFLLAVALVFVTTAAVAAVADAIVPGLPIAAAVALGALVAPPDPVAASAVAGSLGLPRRLVSILEGEGLFNDVTAIVLYHVAIAAAVSGTFSLPEAFGLLILSAVVAVVVGLVLGWLTIKLMGLLGDATLQVGLTLLVPFVSYVLAEELMGSGVLAVLTTALFLAEHTADADDVQGRLTGRSFWEIVDTLVTGVAFGLIGLELHSVFGTAGDRVPELLGWGLAVVAVVVGVRLMWLLPATWLAKRLHTRRDVDEDIPTSWRETVVMWWAGMRGVASVALALAIPLETDDGKPFPGRDEIVFIAFVVIMATLVVQGLTLPWLVRKLGVRADTDAERALERELASRAAGAAKRRLKEIEESEDFPDEVLERLQRAAYDIGARISPDLVDEERREAYARRTERFKAVSRVQRDMLSAARHEVLSARNEPGADPEIVDRVLRYLDVRSLR